MNKTMFIDGWGGNMEKVFVSETLNTVRSAQPQVIIQPKPKQTDEVSDDSDRN